MKKTAVVIALLALAAGGLAAGEAPSGSPFAVEGIQIMGEGELESIEGGAQVRERPNEGRYTEKVKEKTQKEFDKAVREEREPRERSREKVGTPEVFKVSPPIAGPITVTSPTGLRHLVIGGVDLSQHKGTDIRAAAGTDVYMVKSGYIESSDSNALNGGVIVTRNVDGSASSYFHVVANNDIKAGIAKKSGEIIATVGRSGIPKQGGTQSTGDHLHYGEQNKQGGWISTASLFQRLFDPNYCRR